jgi:hypothetical protein
MNTQDPLLAKESDIRDIDSLLCSAQEPIGLTQTFCSNETRPKRLEWLREKLTHNLLWVIRDRSGLAGAMILEQDLCEQVVGIAYIVVAERMRGRKEIGPGAKSSNTRQQRVPQSRGAKRLFSSVVGKLWLPRGAVAPIFDLVTIRIVSPTPAANAGALAE